MLSEGRDFYNIVNTPHPLDDEHVQSVEFVQTMAYQGGEHSLLAGATTLGKFKIQEEKDKCCICYEEYNCGDDGECLPCAHIFHYECIFKWFVQDSKCPLRCYFTCSDRDS